MTVAKNSISPIYEACPSCKGSIPTFHNEVKWCTHCEWNLFDESIKTQDTPYSKIYRKLGHKVGKSLFDDLVAGKHLKPRMTGEKFLAYTLAAFIHLLTILLAVLAILSFHRYPPTIAILISSLIGLMIWNLKPQFRKWPKDKIADRENFKELYNLTDRIADKMNTRRVAGLIVSEDFNAYYTEYGMGPWKKKLICLGLPLLESLPPEEIVALIAHETGHGANGDIARGTFIHSALSSLNGWYRMVHPTHIEEGNFVQSAAIIAVWIANLLGALLSNIPWLGYYILVHLMLRQSQECEYLADRLAAEVSGTKAMTSLLTSLWQSGPFSLAVQKAALSNGEINIFDFMRENSANQKSYYELERLTRLEEKTGLSFDATHPPKSYREKFLNSFPTTPPAVQISELEMRKIRSELDAQKKIANDKLVDHYLNSLYFGS